MTDLRARLAEAHWELYVSSCRDLASCSHIPATFAELNESEQSYHYRYVDVLLSLPGIAIVDLPEGADVGRGWLQFRNVVVGPDGDIRDEASSYPPMQHNSATARAHAAALLAAAQAAERKEEKS